MLLFVQGRCMPIYGHGQARRLFGLCDQEHRRRFVFCFLLGWLFRLLCRTDRSCRWWSGLGWLTQSVVRLGCIADWFCCQLDQLFRSGCQRNRR